MSFANIGMVQRVVEWPIESVPRGGPARRRLLSSAAPDGGKAGRPATDERAIEIPDARSAGSQSDRESGPYRSASTGNVSAILAAQIRGQLRIRVLRARVAV